MNLNEQEIENLLRRAPQPAPPAGLKAELLADARAASTTATISTSTHGAGPHGWLRRWWPVLLPAAASLVCSVVLAIQQLEIRELQETIRAQSKELTLARTTTAFASVPTKDGHSVPAAQEDEEIERLKHRATQLAAEVSELERVQKENEYLRAKLNAPPTFSKAELDALAQAKAKAMSINCINNLKQFGLAVRIWGMNHNDAHPPDSLSMSNELNTPKILVCPADTNRVVAKNWKEYTDANCSYEYLTPSVPDANSEPTRVLSRCPIHGHVGMCDGSVQGEVAKNHPEWLKERDGKLYFER